MTDNEFRLGYAACRAHLRRRLAEPAPARVQLLTGPRQVGKTLRSCWRRAEETAEARGRAALLLDQVHQTARA